MVLKTREVLLHGKKLDFTGSELSNTKFTTNLPGFFLKYSSLPSYQSNSVLQPLIRFNVFNHGGHKFEVFLCSH